MPTGMVSKTEDKRRIGGYHLSNTPNMFTRCWFCLTSGLKNSRTRRDQNRGTGLLMFLQMKDSFAALTNSKHRNLHFEK
jgi:hypothetical protein